MGRRTKKEKIISLHETGVWNISEIATLVETTPSYVASVLKKEGLLSGYYDLYSHTHEPINIYSRHFRGRLGFKTVQKAKDSTALLEYYYRRFEREKDRAGQHHVLVLALTLFNRARWIGKTKEAEVFRIWLHDQLSESLEPAERRAA